MNDGEAEERKKRSGTAGIAEVPAAVNLQDVVAPDDHVVTCMKMAALERPALLAVSRRRDEDEAKRDDFPTPLDVDRKNP